MTNLDEVAAWRGEFEQDDGALSLLRERAFELGFIVESEAVERSSELGAVTVVKWRLRRERSADAGTPNARALLASGVARAREAGVNLLRRARQSLLKKNKE